MTSQQSWTVFVSFVNYAIALAILFGSAVAGLGFVVVGAKAVGLHQLSSAVPFGITLQDCTWLAGGLYLLSQTTRPQR